MFQETSSFLIGLYDYSVRTKQVLLELRYKLKRMVIKSSLTQCMRYQTMATPWNQQAHGTPLETHREKLVCQRKLIELSA